MPSHENKQLIEHLRFLFASVNANLQQTDTGILDLKVAVTDVIVLKEYTEFLNRMHADNINLIDAFTPDPLLTFTKRNIHAFSGTDAVLYLSSRRFARQPRGKTKYIQVKGMAYTGGACSDLGGALIWVDTEIMESATLITHELLHLIGSVHDGEAAHAYLKGSPGAQGCPDERKYIMAKYVKPEKGSFLPLSNCTRDQVKAFLESDRGRCLLTHEAQLWPPLSEALIRNPIVYGSRYCSYLYNSTPSVEYQPYYSDEHSIERCILICVTIDTVGQRVHNMHNAPDYMDCRIQGGPPKVCISQICMDVPKKPPPLHEWLKTRASGEFHVSDDLYK
ncbi:venom metalloproteinase antarease-like TfasMP_A [Dermacentor variabilis]|uniref:venom metalloproteinase antarease-like TfasMP_A n=1 Tax=Dermacentor variabilis TaxID=34621 RepID=UPI003F5C99B4